MKLDPKGLLALILLLLFLPLLVLAGRQIKIFFSEAAPIPANIHVEADKSQADLDKPWQGLSQGGEQEYPGKLVSLSPVTSQIQNLGTRFIRIDHVLEEPFDASLRPRVQQIIDSGAVPIISLSYFPNSVAGSQIGVPTNFASWRAKVKRLVEEVSGKGNMDLDSVYYEVWNEPDGENFGNFDIGRGKDYFELYRETQKAVESAENVNQFYFGGPALADLRRCENGLLFTCQKFWLDKFLDLVEVNNARLDFISWHRYSTKVDDYKDDVNFINDQLDKHQKIKSVEKIITEWGSYPERRPEHNTVFDSAHLVAAVRVFLGHVDLATKFEIRDGPDSGGKGWGILTYNGRPKPVYKALELLNRLRPERILLTGEGTNVTGIASRDSSGVSLILSNYDKAGRHFENVPVRFSGLTPGEYLVRKTTIDSSNPNGKEIVTRSTLISGNFKDKVNMFPNSVISYELNLISLNIQTSP